MKRLLIAGLIAFGVMIAAPASAQVRHRVVVVHHPVHHHRIVHHRPLPRHHRRHVVYHPIHH